MNGDRENILVVIIGALIAAVILQPVAIRARDDRRMRALEFAQRVQERADPASSAGA
jgi:hypothetical protein